MEEELKKILEFEKITWIDIKKERVAIPSALLCIGIVLGITVLLSPSLFPYREFVLFIAGILSGLFTFAIDEIINRAPDRKRQNKKDEFLNKKLDELKSENKILQEKVDETIKQNALLESQNKEASEKISRLEDLNLNLRFKTQFGYQKEWTKARSAIRLGSLCASSVKNKDIIKMINKVAENLEISKIVKISRHNSSFSISSKVLQNIANELLVKHGALIMTAYDLGYSLGLIISNKDLKFGEEVEASVIRKLVLLGVDLEIIEAVEEFWNKWNTRQGNENNPELFFAILEIYLVYAGVGEDPEMFYGFFYTAASRIDDEDFGKNAMDLVKYLDQMYPNNSH